MTTPTPIILEGFLEMNSEKAIREKIDELNRFLKKFHYRREDKRVQVVTGLDWEDGWISFVNPKNQVLFKIKKTI